MFWIIAFAISLLAGLAIAWPIIRQKDLPLSYGLALALVVPVAALFLYKGVGTPDGIKVSGIPQQRVEVEHRQSSGGEMADMITQLESRLLESPDDLNGWILLGRSYKTIQQYARAETALLRALELAPDNPQVIIELAEANMFASGSPVISAEVKSMLERAIALDPNQQKGLWLLGFASSQTGDDALAIDYWNRLVVQMDQSGTTNFAVRDQIGQARARLGMAPDEQTAWQGIDIEVSALNPDFKAPDGAVLFIIARNPQAPGPPLGVRRISNPVFPVNIRLSDADSMIPQSPVSGVNQVQLLARLSLSGVAIAGERDPQSSSIMVDLNTQESVRLELLFPDS